MNDKEESLELNDQELIAVLSERLKRIAERTKNLVAKTNFEVAVDCLNRGKFFIGK